MDKESKKLWIQVFEETDCVEIGKIVIKNPNSDFAKVFSDWLDDRIFKSESDKNLILTVKNARKNNRLNRGKKNDTI